MLPHDFPAKSTVYDHFAQWRDDGTWQHMMDALRRQVRQAAGHEPEPRTACIDSQTVKGTEVGGERGYDGGKKIRGVKRHIVVDSLGLLLVVTDYGRVAGRRDGGSRGSGPLDGGSSQPAGGGPRRHEVPQPRLGRVGRRPWRAPYVVERHRATAGLGGLREAAEALGGGADVRLDRPVPAEQSRLRVVPAFERGIQSRLVRFILC